ncbi:ATP-binding cassette domain-containing protein [Helicobacter kayseriensis]|uniref:ATP-binding cassette domain-containing protein n=1 Tax=Helicobacter kayseriensis TaxID=2905877 RepID=UPI001E5B2B44|nr:ATP-binding cassette domain-containing protein [Helicobacter kayseriensis]MCE3047112.1 ATP-binding cassette domain-containing protein [Helicobacter kayseriensis]MCE3048483.1 ATP-binding cassette domain-containing protein [Helicobacter kayseriensis]
MKLYDLKHLSHFYQSKMILNIPSLQIYAKELIGIGGKNGSGKSTLLRLLAFLESPSKGEVLYCGGEIGSIAILLPEVCLLSRSVRANLEYMFQIRQRKISLQKIQEILDLVGLEPKKFLERSYLELSSGEKQRVGLAQRLLLEPKVLLLDEPTNSLDLRGLEAFSRAIKWANAELESTVITISHDKKWLDANATRRFKLHFGSLILQNQANLLSHNWSKTANGEKYYEFGGGQVLHLSGTQTLDMREGIFIAQEHIQIHPSLEQAQKCFAHTCILQGRIERMGIHPQDKDQIIIECRIGDEILRKVLCSSQDFALSQEVYISFDLQAILSANML